MSANVHPLTQLARGKVAQGQIKLWWQGQMGFAVRGPNATVLFDPFLTPLASRLVQPAFGVRDLMDLDAIVVTHEHSDHFDPVFIEEAMERFAELCVILPTPLADEFASSRTATKGIVRAQPHDAIRVKDVTIHAVHATHGVNVDDSYNFGTGMSAGFARYLGYVADFAGVRVFHAGDTLVSEEQLELLRELKPELALLPINGRDYFRESRANIVGNLDVREAAEMAHVIGAEVIVPAHYDMFADNPGNPHHLVELVNQRYPSLTTLVLSKERPFAYGSSRLGST